MKTYEGICKFCGDTQMIMATDQEEANELITDKCKCGQAELMKRIEAMTENLRKITSEDSGMKQMPQVVVQRLEEIGELVVRGEIDKAQFSTGCSSIMIVRTAKGQVKIVRKEIQNTSAES